jgi:hypothetical protein
MAEESLIRVELTGEQWWRVLRILTGEEPAETPPHKIANAISAQIWDQETSRG